MADYIHEWCERATLPTIENGGMAIRNMGIVALTAYACSLVASLKRIAAIFPNWSTLGPQGDLLQASYEASPEMSAQVIQCVKEYRRRVPQGTFKENDDFSAILKNIAYLESGNFPSSTEAQLQSSHHDPSQHSNAPGRNVRRRSSQRILYYDFVKLEFQRLLSRSRERAQAISQPGDDYDKIRYRNWLSIINSDSGAWLSAGPSPKMFEMSNNEFISAVCRRNTVDDATIPRYAPFISRENPQLFYCACDSRARPKSIDPFGYHFTGCKIGANAIRLHDEVVTIVAKLFRTLRVDAIVEPTRLFANTAEDASNQRPDIFLRNPRGLGRQIIIDVAVTGVDGQSRTSDEAVDRPLQARYDQKMAKYGHVAEQNNLRFIPAIFSHTGQIHDDFKVLVREQIRHKLIDVEGEPKRSKIRGVMKWWTRCISMAIAKTASRNVAFKVARMRDAIMKDQDEFITREVNFDDGALVANDRANLDDVVCNADLYIANQEDFTQGAISQS